MQRFAKKNFLETKKEKNENFGNKTFQSAELRKCSVLRKKSFWEAKNRKMKTLKIRRSRVQNSGNAAFCKKIASGKLKSKNENFGNKKFQSAELRKCSVLRKKTSGKMKNEK